MSHEIDKIGKRLFTQDIDQKLTDGVIVTRKSHAATFSNGVSIMNSIAAFCCPPAGMDQKSRLHAEWFEEGGKLLSNIVKRPMRSTNNDIVN
jgi:hypothetical protein